MQNELEYKQEANSRKKRIKFKGVKINQSQQLNNLQKQ